MRQSRWIGLALSGMMLMVSAARAEDRPRLVVHEWGVLVKDQSAATELGPPGAMAGQLPQFVMLHDKAYVPKMMPQVWRKPVLHFYGPEGLKVKVSIGTPRGRPLFYWPPPVGYTEGFTEQARVQNGMIGSVSGATGINWELTLSAKPVISPAKIDPTHWWSAIREVPGSWVNVKGGSERFIFYEGTARQEPPIATQVSADVLAIRNSDSADSGPVIVLVNDGVKRWGKYVEKVPNREPVRIAKADLLDDEWSDDRVMAECGKQWHAMGMNAAEAEGIVKVWRPDLLNRVGFIVIARMPETLYGKMFPLTIEPKPDELVRVGMVFDALSGQDLRSDWLPALRQTLEEMSKGLSAPNFRQRDTAAARLASMGDLARPFLKELVAKGDPEPSRAAAILLQRMQPPPAAVVPVPAPLR